MTRAIAGFQPDRFVQAIAARSLSQVELAARLDVSDITVSRWKNGKQLPTGKALDEIARELRVTPEWLTRSPNAKPAPPRFRGSIAQMKAERSMLGARLAWADEIVSLFEQHLDYPELNVPDAGFRRAKEISDCDIEEAAQTVRKAWGLGNAPIADVVLSMENAGIIVVREVTGTPRIEGLSAWSAASKRPLVFLCADKGNAYRSRFDAAHELGHLVLHRHLEPNGSAAAHKLTEQQAHRFASAFLAPPESYLAELRMPVSLASLLVLKPRWGLSAAAQLQRLRGVGLISADEHLRLIKLRSSKWGVRAEPGDSDRAPEKPRLLKRCAEMLLREGVFSRESFVHEVGLSVRDIESLVGLTSGALSEERSDVVELALRRKPTASKAEVRTASPSVVPFRPRHAIDSVKS